ncbi:MAG: hypothetical protein P1S60_02650, partial [Anaerolineae bacterium]|nr:hypothetical protein [Anaerolineae bacterium]
FPYESTLLFLLPGVPEELEAIFNTGILPILHSQFQLSCSARGTLHAQCDDEAELTIPLAVVSERYPHVYIKSLAKPFPAAHNDGIRIIATTHAETKERAEHMIKTVLTDLQGVLNSRGFRVDMISTKETDLTTHED